MLGFFSPLTAANPQDADVVIRNYDMTVEVHASNRASATYDITYQVFNPKGLKRVQFARVTDSFRSLSQFSAFYYDEGGKVLERFGMGDLEWKSLISGYSLYEDNKVHFLPTSNVSAYPVTVKYTYKVELKSSFHLPDFIPVQAYGFGLEKGTFTLKDNAKHPTQFRLKNWSGTKRQVLESNVYSWSLKNVPPLKREPLTLPLTQLIPSIELAPSTFKMGKSEGSFQSWQTFGIWISSLFEQGEPLPEEAILEVQQLVQGVSSTEEKARIIYDYLQENTRYVSVQLGIGGYQPSSAKEVAEVRYGDCKALSNYMVHLLKTVDIEAHSALVYSGKDRFKSVPDFPANQFNHVIVCLPNNGDSLWLECTSSTLPFNFLSPGTLDRYALLMDGTASSLVRTPEKPAGYSQQETFLDATISENGNLDIAFQRNSSGVFLPQFSYLESVSVKDQQNWLRGHFPEWEASPPQITVTEDEGKARIVSSLKLNNGVKKAGKWLFVNRLVDQRSDVPDSIPTSEERTQDLYIEFDRTFSETWSLHLPDNHQLRKAPTAIQVKNQLGSYACHVNQDGLTFTIELVLKKGLYPPQTAAAFNELVSPFIGFRHSKWVIQKKD